MIKKVLDCAYNFIARKQGKLFAIIGFSAFGLAAFIEFIFGLTSTGADALGHIIRLVVYGVILAGMMVGYYKKNRDMLFLSLVVFLSSLIFNGFLQSSFGIANFKNYSGAQITNWVFNFVYYALVAAFVVLVILVRSFGKRSVENASHYIFLVIFPLGIGLWVTGIVLAANNLGWNNAIVPLLECIALLFIPPVLNSGEEELEAEAAAEPVIDAVRAKPEVEEKEEAVEPEVQEEEPKEEEKPAPKKAPAKKSASKK